MTFEQLQTSLNSMRFRRAVVAKLVEWLDENLMPGMEGTPKLVLLTEDKVRVPDDAIDETANVLNGWIKSLLVEEQKLLQAEIAVVPPAPPPEEKKPEAQTQPVEEPVAEEPVS